MSLSSTLSLSLSLTLSRSLSPCLTLSHFSLSLLHTLAGTGSQALVVNMNAFLQGLSALSTDPSARVRKAVCQAIILIATMQLSIIEPLFASICAFMLKGVLDEDEGSYVIIIYSCLYISNICTFLLLFIHDCIALLTFFTIYSGKFSSFYFPQLGYILIRNTWFSCFPFIFRLLSHTSVSSLFFFFGRCRYGGLWVLVRS